MCGIVGIYNFKTAVNKELFDLEQLKLRGRDGVGYYTNKEGTQRSINDIKPKCNFNILVANTRAVPTTEWQVGAGVDVNNQQPFENERYVVVHNGIIANDKELTQKYKLKVTSTVDSAILPPLFSKLGVKNATKQLKGSFAILCYDKLHKTLYAIKNFMPLRYVYKNNTHMFYSLERMHNEKSVEVDPYTITTVNTTGVKTESFLKKNNKRVLVICSGGIDSVTTAYLYKYMGYDVTLLHFKYGQAAEEAELFAIKKLSENLKTTPIIIDAVPIFNIFKGHSVLLDRKECSVENQLYDAESTFSYVPNRNAIFSMIASGIAEMNHIDTVAFGGQQMDSVYPDNNNTFVSSVDNTLKYSLNWNTNVKFRAPLINLIKHEIIQIGRFLQVPYQYVCSCYFPKVSNEKIVVCGKCGCCQFRKSAFEMCGYTDEQSDSTVYKPSITLIKNPKTFIARYIKNDM